MEGVHFHERLSAELSHGLFELWMKYVDKEIIKERGKSANRNVRIWRYDVFQSLEEG